MQEKSIEFTSYTDHTECSVTAVTAAADTCMHTYYDVQPWSPCGRYILTLSLPFEDRRPTPADAARICVVDLKEQTFRVVAETRAWGFQTGAHQCWGIDGNTIYFNDRTDDGPIGVELDLTTGDRRVFEGPVWHVAPQQRYAVSPCLIRANLTQPGYGVSVAPGDQIENTSQATADDGLFYVDLDSGEQKLLLSLADVWDLMRQQDRDTMRDSVLYGFHSKINPQGDRIMFVVRGRPRDGGYQPMLVTLRPDGSDVRIVIHHSVWARGGHHPIWMPDGRHVLMNLVPEGGELSFCTVDMEGTITPLVDEPRGSGHPVCSPDGKRLLSDYTMDVDLTRNVTIRLVDLANGAYRDLCRTVSPKAEKRGSPLRRDAHVVWDRAGRRALFQAAPEGRRRLYVIDPSAEVGVIPEMTH